MVDLIRNIPFPWHRQKSRLTFKEVFEIMKTISKILSVVLCLTMVIGLFTVGVSAADTYVKVTDGNLTSGEYVIVCSNGVAMNTIGTGSSPWILTADPTISGDTVTDAKGAVWTLTVNGDKVTMPDANGKTIAPKGGNNNGIKAADYEWTYTFADGKFSFFGNGADTVALASNTAPDYANQFRGYKTTTIADAEKYPSTFTLYKKSGSGSVTPPPATEETEPSTEATTPSETPSTGLNVVAAPVAGTAYKFGMVQQNVSATDVYYLKGGMDGYYMATSTNVNDAIDVYLEETTGGYYLYTMDGTTKTYINMVVSGTHVNGAYEATASTVYRFDADSKTLIAVVNDADYWFGTRNDKEYTTVGPCATSYNGFYCQFYGESTQEPGGTTPPPATEGTTPATKPSTTLAPVANPVAGTAYKFALVQANLSKTLYFNGKMDESGKYFGTSENAAEAVDVYLEAAQGGYYFYFMDGTTKTYLSLEGYIDSKGNQKAAVKLTTEATTVFSYSAEAKTFVHTINDTTFYLGTYGTYNTMSASSTYYITGDKAGDVGVSQFVSTFYAPTSGSSNTGDASFVSVAAAVLVLSAIGGTALIIKKKEN